MLWILCLIGYSVIAAGCVFGLLVAAEKYVQSYDYTTGALVVCGALWPVAALPAAAYIAAYWFTNREEPDDGTK